MRWTGKAQLAVGHERASRPGQPQGMPWESGRMSLQEQARQIAKRGYLRRLLPYEGTHGEAVAARDALLDNLRYLNSLTKARMKYARSK